MKRKQKMVSLGRRGKHLTGQAPVKYAALSFSKNLTGQANLVNFLTLVVNRAKLYLFNIAEVSPIPC